jgi:hypothetical protein
MTRIKVLGLAVMAVFAFSAITATAAFAEAELTLEGGGSATGTSFTSKSEGSTKPVLQGVAEGTKITCKEETNKGTVTGPQTDFETVVFTGCEAFGDKCESGATVGEEVFTISSKLGFISTSKKEYGVLLGRSPATKYECGATKKLEIKGSLIASISKLEGTKAVELEKPFLTWTITGKQVKGVQSILSFASGGKEFLETSVNDGVFEQTGEEFEELETFSKKVELRG